LIKIDQAGEAQKFLKIKWEDRRIVRQPSAWERGLEDIRELAVQLWSKKENNGEEWEFVGKGA
jgi:hypothetical protein